MRSGKSYEVVSQVIVPAVAQGRRVVTNVDGIDGDLIRAYCIEYCGADPDKLGSIVHVKNDQVGMADFFPSFEDKDSESVVKAGDLVAIDEAWRFWGTDNKIHPRHKSFFLEHGHFVNPETKHTCEIVLMIQDIGTLHRFVRSVVAFCFRTHKKVSLGLDKTYSVNIFEGPKMTRQFQIGTRVRNYDPKVFPLYSSFKGGESGNLELVDKRVNIFSGKKVWIMGFLLVFLLIFSIWGIRRFFTGGGSKPLTPTASASAPASGPSGTPSPAPHKENDVSDQWRYVGTVRRGDAALSLMVGANGQIRPESPSVFRGEGLAIAGQVDGSRVTTYSGAHASAFTSALPGGPPK